MIKALKTLIVEDEIDSIDLLTNLIENYCPELLHCGTAQNVDDGIAAIQKLNPDVVLLDVSLGTEKSFEILEKFKNPNFILVFTTAYSEYALKAFENNAVYYLLKPYSISGIKKTVEKITDAWKLNNLKQGKLNKLRINVQGETLFLDYGEMVYLEAQRSYCRIIQKNNKSLLISKSLSELERDLPSDKFLRIHHSFIVNLAHVNKIIKLKDYALLLSNNVEVPVSRAKKEEMLNALSFLNA